MLSKIGNSKTDDYLDNDDCSIIESLGGLNDIDKMTQIIQDLKQ